MAYTTNPHLPKVRMEAVRLVKYRGWSTRAVARHTGYSQSVIVKWCKKDATGGWRRIPTISSKPHHHPHEVAPEVVQAIVDERMKHGRCAEVVHQELVNQGIKVSLSSVKRTLERKYLIKKRSSWKRYHPHIDRPLAQKPGDLVEIDTIHLMLDDKKRIYVITLIDVFSRWSYAKASKTINGPVTLQFVHEAQHHADFSFTMLQSDHGPEFSQYFLERIRSRHRYSRIGKPNDNSHIERFNRTLQEECLDSLPRDVKKINTALRTYLTYYNNHRLHLGINLRTPTQLIPSY